MNTQPAKVIARALSQKTAVHFAYFPSVDAAGADWNTLALRSDDIFFQRPYLHALETTPPEGMRFGYLIAYHGDEPVGIVVCQIKHFSAAQSLADSSQDSEKEPCFFTGLSKWLKRRVSGWVEADIMVCGNLLVTGNHGYWFDPARVHTGEVPEMLHKGLQFAAVQSERYGNKIAFILVKDMLMAQQNQEGRHLVDNQYTEFVIQPNMVLDLNFPDFDGYLNAMSTKYRTRAKRAFKKSELLERRELSFSDLEKESATMFRLYQDIATNAGFNMVDLNEQYMIGLHQAMQGKFRVFGYYLNNEMVCYCTTLHNHHELEAHFLGYNKDLNHEYQLYLNMLYDMIRVAFDSGCHRIVFARTALEIKSSVGAVPEQLLCYLRHQNSLINKFTGTVLDYLKPVEEWQQRHPFKDH